MSFEDFRAGFIKILRQHKPDAILSGEIELVIEQEFNRLQHVAKVEASLSNTKVPVFKTDNRGQFAAKSLMMKGQL